MVLHPVSCNFELTSEFLDGFFLFWFVSFDLRRFFDFVGVLCASGFV